MKLAKALKIKRIDERPKIVDERLRIGDWEGDTIVVLAKMLAKRQRKEAKNIDLCGKKKLICHS